MSQTDIDEAAHTLHEAARSMGREEIQVAALEYAQALGWRPPAGGCDRLAWVRIAGAEGGGHDYLANVAGMQYAIQRLGCEWQVCVVRTAGSQPGVWEGVGVYLRLADAKRAAFEDACIRAMAG